jgi:hypothetical protein
VKRKKEDELTQFVDFKSSHLSFKYSILSWFVVWVMSDLFTDAKFAILTGIILMLSIKWLSKFILKKYGDA